jgi:hypothetical protein
MTFELYTAFKEAATRSVNPMISARFQLTSIIAVTELPFW